MADSNTHSFNPSKYCSAPKPVKINRRWPDNQIVRAPVWCAVDLRDGNQALIEPMSVTQKKQMWHLLVKMGFKQIEVGFPSASQPDFDFVRWLIEENQIPDDVTIQVLVQARDSLIERTFDALDGIHQAIVHVYNSTSPVQREKVFRSEKSGIVDIAINGARKVLDESRKYANTRWSFEYSPESFSGTETDFAIDICNAVIEVWQPTPDNKAIINLPATVECASPNVFADQVEIFCDSVKRRDSILVSVHTHNDRGCAVAAAELAVMAGADRVEGTLMGNGERTGNMDIVTMAMNLYSQGVDPKLDLSIASEIINTVESCTQIKTHPRHPWFGELVYTAFSGSHQDAIKKCLAQQDADQAWDVAYLPINPGDIGRNYESVIRVNSQSGKGGVAFIMESEFGVAMPRWMQIVLSREVQRYSETHQCEVNSQMIWQIFDAVFMQPNDDETPQFQVLSYQFEKNRDVETLKASISDGNDAVLIHGSGMGVISALSDGLRKTMGIDFEVQHFDQIALGEGTDAKAMAFVQIKIDGTNFVGVAQDEDIMSANINSVLVAANRYASTSEAGSRRVS
ncbi:2-isopropylmalate synthase [BD1-7 clade bacterium]|uniref:2-isopropylmalate synthase n=1 Tax=BD1-7 clade bacterium TaxID=2029982 RepID=A0A5S9NUK7_9GAMM|nr:2-isopropylmalate synthase [BD1-7 clade bacterium]CAA0109749.1 2-isopropylmalate synthase [BD1-7 clade bacterium]